MLWTSKEPCARSSSTSSATPAPPDDLTTDYELLDRDVIDSLGILSLVSFIEDHWSIEIDDEELVPDSFATLGAMTALVQGHLS